MRPSNDHRTIDARDGRAPDFEDVLRPEAGPAAERRDLLVTPAERVEAGPGAGGPDAAEPEAEAAAAPAGAGGFVGWYRSRPLVGGLVTVIAGIALFFSSQLELGHLTVHVGIEGMQATILPIVLALSGVLAIAMPAHRIFYGVIALVIAVYSLVAVNLGGFFIGFLLGCVGGIMVVSWAPRRARRGGDDGRAPADVEEASAAGVLDDASSDAGSPVGAGR